MLVRRRGEELSVSNQRLISFDFSDSVLVGERWRGEWGQGKKEQGKDKRARGRGSKHKGNTVNGEGKIHTLQSFAHPSRYSKSNCSGDFRSGVKLEQHIAFPGPVGLLFEHDGSISYWDS